MPGSGTGLLWNEASPAETDIADAAPIRSIVTSVRNGLAVEHNWPSATGANFGYHLLGSCRPFWDVQSNVSSSGTDGRLLVTSDTSRLFNVGSAGTMLLGGATSLLIGAYPGTVPQRAYWAMESGTAKTAGNGAATVTIPNSGYSGIPIVSVCAFDDSKVGVAAAIGATMNATQFEVFCFKTSTGAGSAYSFLWMSLGTRAL
jgi:hypothetical protein